MSCHNPAQRTSAPADSHPVAGSSAGLVIDQDIDISSANGGMVVSTDDPSVVFDDHGGRSVLTQTRNMISLFSSKYIVFMKVMLVFVVQPQVRGSAAWRALNKHKTDEIGVDFPEIDFKSK